MKKLLSLILAVIISVSLVSCGEKVDIVKTDLSKPVTLKWLMPGPGIQKDSAEVFAKFNEELKKIKGFENVTVKIEVIPVSDYQQKSFLMQTAGEQIDILQTYTLDYAQQYRDGLLLDLTDYLTLAPEMVKELPEWIIEMGKVDGGQAIIPNYQKMASAPWGFVIPETHKQYVDDWNKLKEVVLNNGNNDTYYQEIEKYLSNVMAAGDIDKGMSLVSNSSVTGAETVVRPFNFDWKTKKVHHRNEMPEDYSMPVAYKWHRKFFEAGYIRKDILSAKQKDSEGVKDGSILFNAQCWPGWEANLSDNYDIKVDAIPKDKNYFISYKPAAGGMAISSGSKYPDVAMKIINLMNSDKGIELYNLLVYGIEGKHYKVEKLLENGDKYITPKDYPSEGNSSSAYGLWKWIVGNAENAYVTSNEKETYKKEIFEDMHKNAIVSPLVGFVPDTTSIDTKLSQLNAVKSDSGIWEGTLANYEEVYNAYVKDLKAAGLDEARTELQRQVDEFLATK
ncbi:MAG: ABC transporter substrate-binding protein [Clostridia bacterium]|nr:ABC transporter substrate-binding protein [Clostridia bacterium]